MVSILIDGHFVDPPNNYTTRSETISMNGWVVSEELAYCITSVAALRHFCGRGKQLMRLRGQYSNNTVNMQGHLLQLRSVNYMLIYSNVIDN